jgi:hypothetical protein
MPFACHEKIADTMTSYMTLAGYRESATAIPDEAWGVLEFS